MNPNLRYDFNRNKFSKYDNLSHIKLLKGLSGKSFSDFFF